MAYGHIVLAGTKSGIVPNAIKFFTNSKFSHSLITVPDLIDVPMCIEAAESGISMARFDSAYQNNPEQQIEIWEVLISPEVKDVGIKTCLDQLQMKYGFLEIPWFCWRYINKKLGKDIKSQDNWFNKNEICSELCEYYLTAAGLGVLFEGYGDSSVCPEDLATIMKNNPKYFNKIFSNF